MRHNVANALTLTTLAVTAMLAAAPVAAAQGDAPTTHDYRFAWEESSRHLAGDSGETAEGETTNVTLDVDGFNLTALRFTLAWADDVGEPDTLRIIVLDPQGEEVGRASDTATNGTLDLVVRVQEMPPGTVTVRADDDHEAWAVFKTDYPPNANGRGTWTAQITVTYAGDEDGTLGLGGDADDGQAWNMSVDVGTYAGVLVEKTPVANPDEEPQKDPTQMPPPDEAGEDEDPIPDDSERDTSVLSSRGAQSALVVVAAAIGITGALLLARRSSSS